MSFDATSAIFNTLDLNNDGYIDRNEFSQLLGNSAGGYGASGSSSYETSYSSGSYGAGLGGAASYGAGFGGAAGYGAGFGGAAGYGAGFGGASSYEASSFDSSAYGAGAGASAASYEASSFSSGAGAGAGGAAVQTYATDAQGLFQDPNPQVIRRAAAGGPQTYTQNIRVRFLQPPPVPPHGPLIIKEVRPPQPPAPAPVRIRQQAAPLPTPPPLVLRERPPQPPGVIGTQTVIRRLAGLPVPPRSVIIERIPPLPPRPRDVIIERWIPYGAQAKRRVIVQRAAAAQQYAAPRNIIIQYEQSPARIVRQFQRLGVSAASPAAYVQQYGASLLDASTLVSTARSAGVVEDISAPGVVAASVGYGASTYGLEAASLGGGFGGGFGAGFGAGSAASFGGGFSAGGAAGGAGSGYETASSSDFQWLSSSGYGGNSSSAGGFNAAGAVFNIVDANHDGSIDRSEFSQFFQQSA